MVAFDGIEDLFKQIASYSEYSRATLTVATATGSIVLIILSLKGLVHLIQGLRLYFFSQLCCKTDYAKKYGKWALVTGATDGIGLEMAKELAKRGQSIIIVGRNEQKLSKAKEQIEREGPEVEVLTVKIDLSNSTKENYETAKRLIDPDNRDIGVLINNAGTFPTEMTNFHMLDESEFLTIVNVNILSVLHFTKMIMPGMINREKGLIVNISSTVAFMPSPFLNVYGPSKSFVNGFSHNLMEEYQSYPIDIINVTPGAIQTKLFRDVQDNTTFHRPNFTAPAPDDFAKTVINSLSTRISEFCGCFGHAYTKVMIDLVVALGIHGWLFKTTFGLSSSKFKPCVFESKKNKTPDQSGDNTQQAAAESS